MKKKILVLVMFVFCLVGLVACEEAVAPAGEKGDKGATGKSAYEVAKEAGFDGSVTEWLESLKGQQGQKGKDGEAGVDGKNGDNGLEIEVFTYDGGVYWHHVNGKGEEVGEKQLLWYFLDYITLTYSKKEFTEVDTLISSFLADVSAASGKNITSAEDFFNEFADDGAFMGNNGGSPAGLMADNPALFAKYGFMVKWIYEWIYKQPSSNQYWDNDSSHKYESNTFYAFGMTIEGMEVRTDAVHINHGNRNIVGNIANFIDLTDEFTGTSDYYKTASFVDCDRSEIVKGGVALLDPVQIKRSDIATYQLITIAKNDPMIGDGYSFVKWIDGNNEEVTACPQDSAEIFVVTNYDGIFVDLYVDNKDETFGFAADPLMHQDKDLGIEDPTHEGYVFLGWEEASTGKPVKVGAMMDGHAYQATWRKNNVIKLDGAFEMGAVAGLFCADATEALHTIDPESQVVVTPENFMVEIGEKGLLFNCWFDESEETHYDDGEEGVLIKGSGSSILDVTAFAEKWGWFIEFVASKCANKYSGTAFRLWGFTPATEDVATSYPREAARLAAGCVANALECSGSDRGNDNNPPVVFTSLSNYAGFLDAFIASGIELPAEYDADLSYSGSENYIFFKPDYEFVGFQNGEDILKSLGELAQGLEYTIYWAAPVTIDLNGGYILTQEALAKEFLADLSVAAGKEVTLDNFWTLYGSKDVTFNAEGTFINTLAKLEGEWDWFLNYILLSGNDDNKRIWGASDTLGLAYVYSGSSAKTTDGYSEQFFANWVYNAISGTGDSIHSGSKTDYPAPDFTAILEDSEFVSLVMDNLGASKFGIVKAFAKDVASVVKQITYPDHQFLGFYLSTDASKTYVEYKDMVIKGATYVADYAVPVTIDFGEGVVPEYTSAKAIAAAFLADLSEAAGQEVTADNFWTLYGSKDVTFNSEGTFINTLGKLKGKWDALLNYILLSGNDDNKRIWGASDTLGLAYVYSGSSAKTTDGYSEQFFANWVYNFITLTGETIHGGSKTDYPAPAFAADADYSELLVKFGKSQVKALPSELEFYAKSVVYPLHKFVSFTLDGANVKFEDMTDAAKTYGVCYEEGKSLTAPKGFCYVDVNVIVNKFLADMSTAYGSEVTADNFVSLFESKSHPLMGTNDSGDKLGFFGEHSELFETYKPLIEGIYEYAMTETRFLSNDSSHKYELGTLDKFGVVISNNQFEGGSRKYEAEYGNKNIVHNIANFLQGGKQYTGTSEYYPSCDFTGVQARSLAVMKFIAANKAMLVGENTVVVFPSDLARFVNNGKEACLVNCSTGEVVAKANLTLFSDWSSGADYNNSNWTQEVYKTDAWTPYAQTQMRCREKDGVHVVNFANGYSMTERFTYSEGKSLGLANKFAFKVGNYFSGAQPMDIKIKLVDSKGNETYILGSSSQFVSFPVTTGLEDQSITFDAMEVAQIVLVTKSNISGSAFLYIGNATLSYEEK